MLDGYSPYNFETRNMQPFCLIPETLQEGNVVVIRRFDPESTIPLYIRQHWVDNWNQMKEKFESSTKLRLYVEGPPGCGKTCFFWMWAMMKLQEGKRVLFIQYHVDEPSIWVLEDNTLKRQVAKTNGANLVKDVVGAGDGLNDGARVGCSVGLRVGDSVGIAVGLVVGSLVGRQVGLAVGERVGDAVGERVGALVGERVGARVGDRVGVVVGELVMLRDGRS